MLDENVYTIKACFTKTSNLVPAGMCHCHQHDMYPSAVENPDLRWADNYFIVSYSSLYDVFNLFW